MKMCSMCKTELPLESFCLDNRSKDLLHHRCRACTSIYAANYRAKNLDRLLSHWRKYEEVNKEARLAKRREKYAEDKERKNGAN